jgi:hypothetical protein
MALEDGEYGSLMNRHPVNALALSAKQISPIDSDFLRI